MRLASDRSPIGTGPIPTVHLPQTAGRRSLVDRAGSGAGERIMGREDVSPPGARAPRALFAMATVRSHLQPREG